MVHAEVARPVLGHAQRQSLGLRLLADVHGAMLVHGEATPARHHLDDLLAQEGVLRPLGGSGGSDNDYG